MTADLPLVHVLPRLASSVVWHCVFLCNKPKSWIGRCTVVQHPASHMPLVSPILPHSHLGSLAASN